MLLTLQQWSIAHALLAPWLYVWSADLHTGGGVHVVTMPSPCSTINNMLASVEALYLGHSISSSALSCVKFRSMYTLHSPV